jgi:hypothetical protein
MADFGKTHDVFTIEDFLGFTDESWAPPGSIVDLGEWHTPVRARGFQIDSEGKIVKSHGYSVITQLFDHTDLSQVHGMHYWSAGGAGSTIILAGTFGLVSTYQPTATPYQMRLHTILGPIAPNDWTAQPTADPGTNEGPGNLYGCFAEFKERLYYCNGVDWPIRLNNASHLFEKQVTRRYAAMGVADQDLNSRITIRTTYYSGYRQVDGTNITPGSIYYATLLSRYGESPASILSLPTTGGVGRYRLLHIDWANIDTANADAVHIYRLPAGGTVPQLVTTLTNGNSDFLDDVPDSELGVGIPYDVGLPSRFRLLAAYEDRMFAVGGFSNENRVACSVAGYPDQWPATFELSIFGNLGSRHIVRMAVVNGNLYFFLDHGILALVGNSPENYTLRTISDFVGCISPRTLFPWRDGVVFLSRDGLYFFNGSTPAKISGRAASILHSQALGATGWKSAVGAIAHQYYYLSYRDDTERSGNAAGTQPNRTLVVNMDNGRIGVIDDWAFSLSTVYDGVSSIVLGHNPLAAS